MVSPGIKLTPGGSGAKGYQLNRTIGQMALSFATFDPFFQRAPDSTPSRSGPALRGDWRLHPTVQRAEHAPGASGSASFWGAAFRVLVEGPSREVKFKFRLFNVREVGPVDQCARPLQLQAQSAYQATRPPPEIFRGGERPPGRPLADPHHKGEIAAGWVCGSGLRSFRTRAKVFSDAG